MEYDQRATIVKVRGSKNDSDKTILTEKDIVKESGGGKRWSERTWKNSYS